VEKLGEPLGKRLCGGLVIFESRLGFLAIKNLAHQNQIVFFEVAVMRRVLFIRGFWKKFLCWAWDKLGRAGAMPLPYRVDWYRERCHFEEIVPMISDKKTNWIILD
jgi:hypothetical protein